MGTPPVREDGRRLSVPSPGALADRLGVSAATVVLGALGVVAAALGGWWALRPPPGPDVEAILPIAGSVPIPTPAPSAPDPGRIVVDVAGAVVRPGVHELPAASRVADAVEAAGGLTGDADRVRLNLAQPLSDGSRVWVPAIGESAEPEVVPVIGGAGGSGGPAVGGSGSASVDINTATAAELETLPGIGPSLAAAIVEHRRRSGPFRSVDELIQVAGIGPVKLEQIRPKATAGGQ